MKTWERALVGPDMTLREALASIDSAGSQMALVVDAERRLLGTLSDGDARRGLLKGLSLTDKGEAILFGREAVQFRPDPEPKPTCFLHEKGTSVSA